MKVNKPIIIAIIIFSCVVFAYFLIFPSYRAFNRLQVGLAEKKAEYNAQFEYYSNIAKIYDRVLQRNEEFEKIDDALPDDPNLGQLSYYLYSTARKGGLEMNGLSLSRSSAGEGEVSEMTFTLNLNGDYNSIKDFLALMERSARIFEVSNISFGSSQDSGASLDGGTEVSQTTGLFNFLLQVKTQSYSNTE